MRILGFQVLFQPYSHTLSQRENPVFLVFALSDMNGFSLEVHIRDFQVNHLLSAQTGRVDQSQDNPLLEKRWCSKKLFELLVVQDDGQFGVFFQGRQCDGILVHSQQPVIISQTIDHVFETGAGWRQGITGKCGQVLVDFFGVNKLRKFPEMDDKQGDTPDVIL